jgi:hypothetical protein
MAEYDVGVVMISDLQFGVIARNDVTSFKVGSNVSLSKINFKSVS